MRTNSMLVCFMLACGGGSAETTATTGDETPVETSVDNEESTPFGLMNGARPQDGMVTAGQPTSDALEQAQAGGVATVISLRAEGEPGQDGESETIERLGLHFERLVIRGPEDLTAENARALEELLSEASNRGDVLVHCGSSNRVGALFALRAFWVFEADIEAAIETGREAGLTRLEDAVRAHLLEACGEMEPGEARCPASSEPSNQPELDPPTE